jgi:hypothetical protein
MPEGLFQEFLSPGIKPGQLVGVEAMVGNIAAAAAGNPHFSQYFSGFFQQYYFLPGIGLGTGNGAKKTGRAAANNYYFLLVLGHAGTELKE